MDISGADKMKLEFRLMLWYLKRHLKKKYKTTLEDMENDLNNCGNPAIYEIWDIINKTSDEISETYQKDIVREFSLAFLWILYRDTAYLPITMYVLKQFYDKKEDIYPSIEKYYKEPSEWYVNAWNDTLAHTKELKESGKLAEMDGEMSEDEKIFVPMFQEQKWKKLYEHMDKEIKMKKVSNEYEGDDED